MDKIEDYDFGLRLKKLRKHKKLSQEELGKKIGVTKSTIYRYESNTLSPSLEKAIELVRILDTSLDYLMGIDKVPILKLNDLSEEQIEWLDYTIKFILKRPYRR